jgi:hypothetical protein
MTAVEDHRELTQRLSPQVVLLLSPLCLLRCCLRPEAEALARFIDLTATHCDPTLIHREAYVAHKPDEVHRSPPKLSQDHLMHRVCLSRVATFISERLSTLCSFNYPICTCAIV